MCPIMLRYIDINYHLNQSLLLVINTKKQKEGEKEGIEGGRVGVQLAE